MIEEREELQGQLIASGQVVASLIATKGAKGDKGDKGDQGNQGIPGQDGISPIVTSSKSGKVTTLTIVDAGGTKTATINDGEDGTDGIDGTNGQDGFSPVASVSKVDDTATITITDANGTTTASISDGVDGTNGTDGQDGQDGFSPVASVSKVGKIATITITDSQGTTTAEIRDGEDGQGSGDMLKSTYDTNNNGIVDNAELVNSHTVLSDVPADAVFTDTTYTAGTNVSISAENVISATDTTYTAGTGIDITGGVISNTQTSAEWGNITGTLSNQTDLNSALGGKANTSDLSTVATSGSYTDLSDKPTIPPEMVVLSYGHSTWNDFITAFNKNAVVYCKVSSTSDPAALPQKRYAFMAYISVPSSEIESVEFQYYRSVSSHSSSQQGDEVYIYTLNKTNGGTWSFTTRDVFSKIVAGTGLSSSYNNNTLTLSSNITVPTKTSDLTNDSGYITNSVNNLTNYTTTSGMNTLLAGKEDNIPIQNTAPVSPEENDLWIDTANDNTLKYYDGANWVNVSDTITGDTLPIGSIMPYGSSTAPNNWLVCDGSAVSRTTYSELFAVIGTSFGSGDGSTTFNLPDLTGRVAVGLKDNDSEFGTIGETGGEKAHTLITNEMPSHTHTPSSIIHGNYEGITPGSSWSEGIYTKSVSGTDLVLNNTGGGQAHNNLQPYQVVCYIIKANQSAGLIANVSNTQSDSTTDTYSCDYINKSNEYSTTEVKTGKFWIDGKPIYRVCKNIGYLPNVGRIVPTFENIIPQNVVITHLDAICHRYFNDVHDYRPLSDMVITFLYRPSLYALYVDTNENYSDWECIAIIEYTKS